jgi:hypothetical protein
MDLLKYASKRPVLVQEDFNLERCCNEIKVHIETLQKKIKNSREQMSTLQQELKPITRAYGHLKLEVDNLDNKIKSCLKQQQQKIGKSSTGGYLNVIDEQNAVGILKNKEVYEEMFYILWRNPRYLAVITPSVKTVDRSEFVNTINNDLWSDHFDSREDQVLLTLFKKVIDAHFKQYSKTGDIGSVFRGNTVVTLMLSLYCNRTDGLQALETVLYRPLKEMIENKSLNLEIDAVKVYKEVAKESGEEKLQEDAVTPEKALASSSVQALRNSRMKKLKTITQKIFNRITQTAEEIPYGIRFICKQVAESAQKYFPNCNRDDIGRLIGGQIFLRFFNPVIVQPARANMFRENKLIKRQQRNLILVTRILQSQSNGSTFRDQMMLELNGFLEENRERTLQYFQRLIEIDSLEDNIEIDSMLDSTKRRQTSITLKCNQIFLFHRLIWEHKDRWDLPDDPILQCIVQIGKPPAAVSLSKDFEVVLKLRQPATSFFNDDEKSDLIRRSRYLDIDINRRSTLGNANAAVKHKIPIWNILHFIFHGVEYPSNLLTKNNESLLRFLEKLLQWARANKPRGSKLRLCDRSTQFNFGCSASAETASAPVSRQVSQRVIFGSFPESLERTSTQRRTSLVSQVQKCMDSINLILIADAKESKEQEYNDFLLDYVKYVRFLTLCDRRSTKKLQKMRDAKATITMNQTWLADQKEKYKICLQNIKNQQKDRGSPPEKRKSFVSSLKRSVSVFGPSSIRSKINTRGNESD